VRFSVASAVLMVLLGLVLGRVLGSTVEQRALGQSEQTATSIGRLAVQPLLTRSDFLSGDVSAGRLDRLDAAMSDVVADGTVVRAKVFDRNGTVLYSDAQELVGQTHAPEEGLAAALDGRVYSELQEAHDAEDSTDAALGHLLEVYVPVQMDGDVVGAFELYLPYGPVAAEVQHDVTQLAWWLAGGLLVLWLSLVQIMVSASRRLQQHARENERLAEHDMLTGLPNRRHFSQQVAVSVAAAESSGGTVAVLFADLDRFKEVNDTLGHHIGDKLIVAVGDRLRQQLRDVGMVARLGGDEFAVLMPAVATMDDVRATANRFVAALRAPFVIDDISLEIGASLGLACYPEHGHDATRLMQCADIAMYSAKHAHWAVMTYDAALDVNTPARLALYGELRRAIDEDQLTVHYQPRVDLGTGAVIGAEALVRWQHPERGLLQPDSFIPLAEQTGLIRPMTSCVLRAALRECSGWRAAGRDLSVSVNLSVRSLLDPDLVTEVAGLLRESGLPASALELEITETTAMVEPVRSLVVLGELHALGVQLSLDDYGTGHSSLAYLSELPVDALKIDRSFVQAMDSSAQDATIVRSTIDLARNLGLQVVAEGVETAESWQMLAALGCDSAQGYWLARPEPAGGVLGLVEQIEQRLGTVPVNVPSAT